MIPAKNKILIEPHVKTSDLGFVETEKTTFERATVLALGTDVEDYEVGDTVYYKSYAPSVIELSEDESYVTILADDVEGYDRS